MGIIRRRQGEPTGIIRRLQRGEPMGIGRRLRRGAAIIQAQELPRAPRLQRASRSARLRRIGRLPTTRRQSWSLHLPAATTPILLVNDIGAAVLSGRGYDPIRRPAASHFHQ